VGKWVGEGRVKGIRLAEAGAVSRGKEMWEWGR